MLNRFTSATVLFRKPNCEPFKKLSIIPQSSKAKLCCPYVLPALLPRNSLSETQRELAVVLEPRGQNTPLGILTC